MRKSQRRNISLVCEIRHLSNDPINISDQKQGARRIIPIAKLNIRASAIPHKSEEGIALTAHQINEKEAFHASVLSRKMKADWAANTKTLILLLKTQAKWHMIGRIKDLEMVLLAKTKFSARK